MRSRHFLFSLMSTEGKRNQGRRCDDETMILNDERTASERLIPFFWVQKAAAETNTNILFCERETNRLPPEKILHHCRTRATTKPPRSSSRAEAVQSGGDVRPRPGRKSSEVNVQPRTRPPFNVQTIASAQHHTGPKPALNWCHSLTGLYLILHLLVSEWVRTGFRLVLNIFQAGFNLVFTDSKLGFRLSLNWLQTSFLLVSNWVDRFETGFILVSESK